MKVVMANLMPNRPKTGGEAAVWACKLIFLLIGVASTVVFLGKLVIPLLSHSLPNLCKSVGPRHLFIAVNSIIIVVWKLHGVQHHHDDHHETNKSSYSISTSSSLDCQDPLPPELIVVDSSPSIHPSPSSESCPVLIMGLSDKLEIQKTILNEQVIRSDDDRSSDPWPPPPSEDPLPENDTMDAMWKAIMGGGTSPDKNQNLKKTDNWERSTDQATTTTTTTSTPTLARASAAAARRFGKSDTFREVVKVASHRRKEMRKSETFRESSPSSSSQAEVAAAGWRGRDRLVIGQDELFNKVEAFIKMNYDQLRLQRQESEQRYVENNMVTNAAY